MSRTRFIAFGGKKKPRAFAYLAVPWFVMGGYLYTDIQWLPLLLGPFLFVIGLFDYEAMGLGGPFGIKEFKRPGPAKPWED